MFIEITNPTNPLRIENFLRPYKRGEKEFTPEVACEILTMTNHPRNIRDMLRLVLNQPQNKRSEYTDIVLSAFDHRAQPAENAMMAQTFSPDKSFLNELNHHISTAENYTYSSDSVFYLSAAFAPARLLNNYQKFATIPDNSDIIYTGDIFQLFFGSLKKVRSIKFPNAHIITMQDIKDFPPDFDVSGAKKVNLDRCNLSDIKKLSFQDGANVSIINLTGFPQEIDTSGCSRLNLAHNDLRNIPHLKFKNGSCVNLTSCKNIPEDLDVSMCDSVYLDKTKISRLNALNFKKGSTASLKYCFLPPNTNVSMCSKVNFTGADLTSLKSLKFADNAHIILNCCRDIDFPLDFSNCEHVELENFDITHIPSIKFKNKQQQEESKLKIPKDWHGIITYAEKENFFSSLLRKYNTHS